MYHKVLKNTGGRTATEIFVADSLAEWSREVQKAWERNPSIDSLEDWRLQDREKSDWVGRQFENAAEVFSACRSPWKDGLKTLLRLCKQLEDATIEAPVSQRRRPVWDEDSGDEMDFDRLKAGDAWWRTTAKRTASAPRQITLIANLGASGSTGQESMFWRGAAAVCCAERLEAAGYQVAIWIGFFSKERFTDSTSQVGLIRLKDFRDRLNKSTLASAISGWFFRTVCFGAACLVDRTPKGGLGRAKPIEAWADYAEPDKERRVVLADVWTEQAAVSLVKRIINRLNQEVQTA